MKKKISKPKSAEPEIPYEITFTADNAYKMDVQDTIILEGFTKRPPKEKPLFSIEELNKRAAYVTQLEMEPEFVIPLICKGQAFERDKNPVYVIESFLLAGKAGVYPPEWALNFIFEVFEKYHASNGRKSIDSLFGVVRGKGQVPPFKTLLMEDRNEDLCLDVFRLNLLFKISIEDACNMVAERLKEEIKACSTPYDRTGWGIQPLMGAYLQNIYKKQRWLKDTEFKKRTMDAYSPEKKIKYLNSFPLASIPSKYHHHLKK